MCLPDRKLCIRTDSRSALTPRTFENDRYIIEARRAHGPVPQPPPVHDTGPAVHHLGGGKGKGCGVPVISGASVTGIANGAVFSEFK